MLTSFVLDDSHGVMTPHVLHASHNLSLVILSLVIAFISCLAALSMADSNRNAFKAHRRVSLLCASMVLGLGIWDLHFIGMLAIQTPHAISYNKWLTALSIIPGMLAAWLALRTMQVRKPSIQRILASGICVGLGIAAMHYCGLAAVQINGGYHFHLTPFFLSAIAGVTFSILAFASQRYLQQKSQDKRNWSTRVLPSIFLTIAIASMHYVSMISLHLQQAIGPSQAHVTITNNVSEGLAILLFAVSMLVFLVLGLSNGILRYRDLWQAIAVRDARLNAIVETSPDVVVTINDQGLIQDFNAAAEHTFGYQRSEVIGHNVSILMPSPLAEQHDQHLHKHLRQPSLEIDNRNREALGKHKDGRLIPIRLTLGKAQTDAGTIFVGFLKDISEQKRTDAQLRIAASVFQHVREGVAIVDGHHNISDVNPAFLQLMEKKREECIGREFERLYEDAELPADMGHLWHQVAKDQYWQNELILTRNNGTITVLRLSISPVLNELQRPHHYIAVLSDVTERPSVEVQMPVVDASDRMNGLPNQSMLLDRMSNALIMSHRNRVQVGVVVFQLLPPGPASQHGMAEHTTTLCQLVQVLQQQLRSTDTLARLSNDQLGILILGIKDNQAFSIVIERLTRATHTPALLPHIACGTLLSGASCSPAHGETALALLDHAQRQLKPLPIPQQSENSWN